MIIKVGDTVDVRRVTLRRTHRGTVDALRASGSGRKLYATIKLDNGATVEARVLSHGTDDTEHQITRGSDSISATLRALRNARS